MKLRTLTLLVCLSLLFVTISGWDYSDYDDDDGGEDDDYDYDDDDDDYDYDIVEESVLSERESGEKKKKPKCPRIKAGKYIKNGSIEKWQRKSFRTFWCPEKKLKNGKIIYNCGLGYGRKARHRCNDGFGLRGPKVRECQLNCKWSRKDPVCLAKCPSLPRPANGIIDIDGHLAGDKARYGCFPTYELRGDAVRVCQDDCKWSGEAPICSLIDCGPLPALDNGNVSVIETTVFNEAKYSCRTGYKLKPAGAKRVCLNTGKWSDMEHAAACIPDCGPLPNISNGTTYHADTTVGQVAVYGCYHGFKLVPEKDSCRRKCLPNGNWSGSEPNCIPDCEQLKDPENGDVEMEGTLDGSKATYSCHPTFTQTSGTNERICQGGNWSGEKAKCSRVDCGSPPALDNGNVSVIGTTVFNEATYSCKPGYRLKPAGAKRVCLNTGKWSGMEHAAACIPDCGRLPNISNGTTYHADTTVGQVAVYGCYHGFKLVPEKDSCWRKCLPNGNWSGSEPNCIPECRDPTAPQFGSVFVKKVAVKKVAEYSCGPGYNLDGTTERTCQDDGEWDGDAPVCKLVDCGNLTDIDHGTVIQSGTIGTSVYSCKGGFRIEGNVKRTCQSNGSWSGTAPKCVCNKPVDVMFVVDGSTSVGCQNFHKQLQFLVDFVRRLEIGPGSNQTRVGVIQFSSRVYPHFYMKTYDNKNEMINAIKKIDWSRGSTKTYAALDFVRKYSFKTSAGDRPNVPNVVIVLTDGRSSSSSLTGRAAAKLKNVPGTTVIAIGIARADKNEVRRIATGTGDDNCFLLATFDILSGILKNLEEKTCSASSGGA